LLSDDLNEKQANQSQKLNLIQEIVTRWNYTYLMMERLIKLSEHVNAVLRDSKNNLKDLILADSELKDLTEYVDVLFCFHDATVRLSAEKNASISYVIPILQAIKTHLEEDSNDSELKKRFKAALLKSLTFYIEKYKLFDNEFLIAATYLDPR
jgi:hypothetical protein